MVTRRLISHMRMMVLSYIIVSYSSTPHFCLALSPLVVPDHERENCHGEIEEDGGMDKWGAKEDQGRWWLEWMRGIWRSRTMVAWTDEGIREIEEDGGVHRWWRGGVEEDGGMDRCGCWGDQIRWWCGYMEAPWRLRNMVAWIDGGTREVKENGGVDGWGRRGVEEDGRVNR